jgi:TetR/AcrR family transcriptional regulator, regulator of autoinduction and epiphytic fitness
MTTPRAETRVDGRTERSRRTREAIVSAHMALVLEGELKPTAPVIAQRAGISVRSLWLHFADMEAVFAATAEAVFDQVGGFGPRIDPHLPLDERIRVFVERKLAHIEAIDPFARASELREAHSPALRRNHARHVSSEADHIAETFEPELAGLPTGTRDDVLAALTATTAWRCWTTMREQLGLDRDRITSVLELTVAALLASVAPASPRTEPLPAPDIGGEGEAATA